MEEVNKEGFFKSTTTSVVLFLTVLILLYHWSTSTFGYWKKRKVPFIKPIPLFGNIVTLITNKDNLAYLLKKYCDQMLDERFYGLYITRTPVLILNDAELVVKTNIKDFSIINDKGFHINDDFDMILNNLFFLKGHKWRYQRNKFSPAFTSGKLKSLYFNTIQDCSKSFSNHLKKSLSNSKTNSIEIDIKYTIEDLFTDIVCKCILGLEMHSIENPDRKYKKIQDACLKPNWRLHLKQVLQFLSPYLDRKVRICDKYIEDYFYNFAKDGIDYRNKNNIKRNDLFQILINIYNENNEDNKNIDVNNEEYFGIRQLAANLFVFIVAGYETSSLTITFLMQKLALYPDVQNRLRKEIVDIMKNKQNGEIEYDDFKNMKYLDMIIDETLRMYPVLPAYFRRTITPYTIPDSDITLDAGTYIVTPTVALHYNEKYWPNPTKFDPERFSEENKHLIVPGSFIPFNIGPRECIGKRFAFMQMKSAICAIILNFEVKRSPKTVETTDFVVGSMIMVPKEKIIVDLVPLKVN